MPRRRFDDEYEDDDDEDDRPRRRPRPARKKESNTGKFILILVIGGMVLVLAAGGAVVAWQLLRAPSRPAADAPDTPGLVAHWSFDDAAASRGHPATLVNARLGPGVRGLGLELDGRPDQYAEIGPAGDLNFGPGAGFTVTGWFRTFDPSGTVVSFRHTVLPTQVEVLVRNGRLQGIIGDDTDATRQGFVWGSPVADGQWHHFALVRSGPMVGLYLDGLLQAQHTGGMTSGPVTTDLRAIGCERLWVLQNDMRWGRPGFVGGIDEVSVFARALDEAEVRALARR